MTQADTVLTQVNTAGNTEGLRPARCRCFFITWNSPPDDWRSQLTQKTDEWHGQLEQGASGNIHVQACFRWKNARFDSEVRKLFVGAHVEKCGDWKSAIVYCTKDDTRVECRGDTFRERHYVPLRWQAELLDILAGEVDDRKIYWVWSRTGGFGKTTFAKHLYLTGKAEYVSGRATDVFFALAEAKSVKGVVFDIPRDGIVDYAGLESVKNGIFFSGKYESKTVAFATPHVIVLANYPPDQSKLSVDRWVVNDLSEDYHIETPIL
nr:MAG: replication associated protein [Cressdnaviricota sp.]